MSGLKRHWKDSYGGDTVCWLRKPATKELFRTYSPHGLRFAATWPGGTVYANDGTAYMVCRELNIDATNFLHVLKGKKGLDAGFEPVFTDKLYSGGYILSVYDEEKDSIHFEPQYMTGNWFTCDMNDQGYHLIDASGEIDLTVEAIADEALYWYAPGHDDGYNDYQYMIYPVKASGVIEGKTVSGCGSFDMEWCHIGTGVHQHKRFECMEKLWVTWYTVYEDGSYEVGRYLRGHGSHAAACIWENRKGYIARSHSCEMDIRPDGILTGAVIKMDDDIIDITVDTNVGSSICAAADGQAADELSTDMSWVDGHAKRRGNSKLIKNSWVVIEYVPRDCVQNPRFD